MVEAVVVGAAGVGGTVVVGANGAVVVAPTDVGLTLFPKTALGADVGVLDTVVGLVVTTTELRVNVVPGPTGTVATLSDEAVPDERLAVNRPIPNAAATQPIAPRAIGHRRTLRRGTGGDVT